jgi:hypothetical protein
MKDQNLRDLTDQANSRLSRVGIAPVTPEIANVSPQAPSVSSQLEVIESQLASIPFDFTTVGAKFGPWSSFPPVLAILAHIGSQLSPVLSDFAPVAKNFPYPRPDLSPIRAQLSAFPGSKIAAGLLLG